MLYNSSRKRKQQAILGSKSQHSTPENTSRKLFIYQLFHQLFPLHFLNAQLQTQLFFLALCSRFREKAPFPSLISRSSKVWVSDPRHRLKHTMGSRLCLPAHQRKIKLSLHSFTKLFYFHLRHQIPQYYTSLIRVSTHSTPNGSICIWKEGGDKKGEQNKR